jgi:hypothetical protein
MIAARSWRIAGCVKPPSLMEVLFPEHPVEDRPVAIAKTPPR